MLYHRVYIVVSIRLTNIYEDQKYIEYTIDYFGILLLILMRNICYNCCNLGIVYVKQTLSRLKMFFTSYSLNCMLLLFKTLICYRNE